MDKMRDARWLRFAIRIISSAIDSQELEREESRINVNKPYKPRRLKQDQYHKLMRQANEHRPPNGIKKNEHKRTREKWERENKVDLKRRGEFVRKQKKLLDLD